MKFVVTDWVGFGLGVFGVISSIAVSNTLAALWAATYVVQFIDLTEKS